MRLRFKFNAAITLACALGIGAASGLSWWVVQKSSIDEMEQQIRLLRANALAVRDYTLNSIDPLLSEDNDILFLPQSVTAYAATSVFATFRNSFPEYSYKEAALNPTNPANRADAFERGLIEAFRADAGLTQQVRVVEADGQRYFTMAFPLKVGAQGCLTCHSTPEAAPPAMVDLYGRENGFGWTLGETIGAQIIAAPMSLVESRARETVGVLVGALSLAFLLVLLVTNLLLTRIVVRPVRRMSEVAEQVSLGDFEVPEYAKPGKDEISSLSASFNRMRRSLESAMKMIDD
ncbi:MAG: DUF3365 domain-containing protein [Pseudomonadota bacterium]|nr:DUF3365 domain-containing protein [Pseudomonadota bacterium]